MSVETAFEDLHRACSKGERETATTLLKQKDLDIVQVLNTRHSEDGTTVLHMAADEGLTGVVEQMLDKGPDINIVDMQGLNVLHWAMRQGKDPHLVEVLLQRPDCFSLYDLSANEEGFTPFLCGLKNGSAKAVKALLRFDGQQTPWDTDKEAKQIFKINFERYMGLGHNIYAHAMKIDDSELIKLLLEKDQNWQHGILIEQDGKNGLVLAAECKLWENVEILMLHDNLNLSQSQHEEVLVEVVKECNHKLLENILKKELRKDTLHLSSRVLHAALASPKRNKKIVEMLVQYGADITGFNKDGLNIVHVIASNGDSQILSVIKVKLPQKSANKKFQTLLTQKCSTYKTVLCFGDVKQHYELCQCNALHIATLEMQVDVLNKLLVYCANPLDTDGGGRSPLQLVTELTATFENMDNDSRRKYDDIYDALLRANKEGPEMNSQKALFNNLEKNLIGYIKDVKTDVVSIKKNVVKIDTTTVQSQQALAQVTESVTSLEQVVATSSEKTENTLKEMKDELILLKCSSFTEDIVDSEIIHMVAKEVGRKPRVEDSVPVWESLADWLFQAAVCPKEICSAIKKKIYRENNTDQDCALQFLVIWKSLICQKKIQLIVLQKALKEIDVEIPELNEFQELHAKHWQTSQTVELSDKQLGDIAGMVGKEWKLLGLQLDLEKSELDQIEMQSNTPHEKILEMLCTWKRKNVEYTDVQVIHLCTALQKVGRADIAKSIKATVNETAKATSDETTKATAEPKGKSELCNLI